MNEIGNSVHRQLTERHRPTPTDCFLGFVAWRVIGTPLCFTPTPIGTTAIKAATVPTPTSRNPYAAADRQCTA
jgi:hypothetical protein